MWAPRNQPKWEWGLTPPLNEKDLNVEICVPAAKCLLICEMDFLDLFLTPIEKVDSLSISGTQYLLIEDGIHDVSVLPQTDKHWIQVVDVDLLS